MTILSCCQYIFLILDTLRSPLLPLNYLFAWAGSWLWIQPSTQSEPWAFSDDLGGWEESTKFCLCSPPFTFPFLGGAGRKGKRFPKFLKEKWGYGLWRSWRRQLHLLIWNPEFVNFVSWPDYNEFSPKKKNVSAPLASSIGLYLRGWWDKMFELGHILKNPVLQWANIFELCLLGSSNWKTTDSGSPHRLKNWRKLRFDYWINRQPHAQQSIPN